MNKEKYLTKRWNNILTFGLGIPTLIYGLVKIQTDSIGFGSFLILTLIGVVF